MEILTVIEKSALERNEEVIERGLKTFVEVGTALMEIRDRKLYRQAWGTFEDYCRGRWGIRHSYANYLMDAAQVVTNLKTSTIVEVFPLTESQARPLTGLTPEEQVAVWPIAVETAPNGKVTAAHVQRTVDEYKTPPIADDLAGDEDEPEGEPETSPYRFKMGDYAHCKYCYQNHADWDILEPLVWVCKLCDHETKDAYMDVREGPEEDEYGYDWTEEKTEIVKNPGVSMAVHYSSDKPDWETPQDLFNSLNSEFCFTIDVCATDATAKCKTYFTPDNDGLAQDWSNHICWMNPPYGNDIPNWVSKAYQQSKMGATVVCLVPARVDTAWWWSNCLYGEIRFLKGRLKFKQNGSEESAAPFPSAVVVFSRNVEPTTVWWDWRKDVRI